MLNNQYTINLDEETAATVEALARITQRKPRELLRLLLVPAVLKAWADLNNELHPENREPLTAPRFPQI